MNDAGRLDTTPAEIAPVPPADTPGDLPRPAGELPALERAWAPPPAGWRRLSAVNNTHIGAYYLVTAFLFFVLGGVLALIMRTQLMAPHMELVDAPLYNQLFTMHGTVMMFLFAVPVVEAVAVYLLPGMLGARDLPFPRLSAYAFWAYAVGGLAFFCTIFFGASPDGGWFMYPPLTSKAHSPGVGADWWLLGIGFIEISAIAGAIEVIVGVLFTRAPGMTLSRMPVFAWAMLVASVMVVIAFPPLIAGTLLLELERALDWPFFIPARGGDPLLWQHLFWFFGHPEVYIIFLPAAGLVSTLLPALTRRPLVGHRAVVVSLAAIGALSFFLWLHHMFSAGLSPWAVTATSIASLAIAIPSGIQLLAWIATLAAGRVRASVPTLFLLGFLALFLLGGLTGIMVALAPFDSQAHDSYFVVAHLHYVLIGGMLFPVLGALYFWFPLYNGHALSHRLGCWAFGLMFAGFNLAFLPMHWTGLIGMPRRVVTYDAGQGWAPWNLLSTLGAYVLALGVALLLADVARRWRLPRRAHGNPWDAGGLEWLPNGDYGVRSVPQVRGEQPLWQQDGLAREVHAGAHWLPGTVFGGRETLMTSPSDAAPWQLLRLPGDGWSPFVAALGTAGFFLALTVGWLVAAALAGLVALAAILHWLWQSDTAAPAARAEVARGHFLPTQPASRWRSHSFWAMVIVLGVDASILASLGFTHLHVSMALEVCPPPGAALPPARWTWTTLALLLGGSLAVEGARRALARSSRAATAALLGAALLCVLACLGVELFAWREAGLSPRAQAWGASVAALLAWQWLHLGLLMLAAAYLLARLAAARLRPEARASLDNVALLWHWVGVQGAAGLLLVRALADA